MSDPKFIGGAGLKKSGAGLSIATKELQARYLTYDAAEAIAVGEWVALNFNATEPDGNYGNSVSKALSTGALIQHAMGVAVTAAAAGGEVIIQVEGRCDVARIPVALILDAGKMLSSTTIAGHIALRLNTTGGLGAATAVGVLVTYDTTLSTPVSGHPGSTVWLINPLNQ